MSRSGKGKQRPTAAKPTRDGQRDPASHSSTPSASTDDAAAKTKSSPPTAEDRPAASPWVARGVFVVALITLIAGAAGGPGWATGLPVLATDLGRPAAAPLYGLVATVAAYLPVGEPGFRLAIANALVGAVLLVGLLRAARALLPKDPLAGLLSVVVLALTPAFRDAAGFAGPWMLASCGLVWAIALALEHAKTPSPARAFGALACAGVTLGAAPWLGVALVALVAWWLRRTGASTSTLVTAAFGLGLAIVVLWLDATGNLLGASPDLGALVTAAGHGSSTIVVGAGLLGAGFAAVTNLPSARWLALAIGLAALHAIVVDHEPLPMLALLALGTAVIPSAIVRVVPSTRRHAVALIAAIPIVGIAALRGPATSVDDPGATPARLAGDLTAALPAGPGVFFTRRPTTFGALEYARTIAGARPDVSIVPPLPAALADHEAVNAMRRGLIVASEVPRFGRLDARFAYPRGRAFQFVLQPPTVIAPIVTPAHYASRTGAEEATLLAVDRALYEAVNLRLGAAARAAGLAERFGAADLAILSTTAPSRPAFFGFLPDFGAPPGPWMIDVLGDDLAWTVGIDLPLSTTSPQRKLHGLWRALWLGQIQRSDPRITELGPAAVAATDEIIATFTTPAPPPTTPPDAGVRPTEP